MGTQAVKTLNLVQLTIEMTSRPVGLKLKLNPSELLKNS